MGLIGFVVVLVIIGVIMWLVNGPCAQYIWGPLLRIINLVVLIVVVIYALWWVLDFFGLWAHVGNLSLHRR